MFVGVLSWNNAQAKKKFNNKPLVLKSVNGDALCAALRNFESHAELLNVCFADNDVSGASGSLHVEIDTDYPIRRQFAELSDALRSEKDFAAAFRCEFQRLLGMHETKIEKSQHLLSSGNDVVFLDTFVALASRTFVSDCVVAAVLEVDDPSTMTARRGNRLAEAVQVVLDLVARGCGDSAVSFVHVALGFDACMVHNVSLRQNELEWLEKEVPEHAHMGRFVLVTRGVELAELCLEQALQMLEQAGHKATTMKCENLVTPFAERLRKANLQAFFEPLVVAGCATMDDVRKSLSAGNLENVGMNESQIQRLSNIADQTPADNIEELMKAKQDGWSDVKVLFQSLPHSGSLIEIERTVVEPDFVESLGHRVATSFQSTFADTDIEKTSIGAVIARNTFFSTLESFQPLIALTNLVLVDVSDGQLTSFASPEHFSALLKHLWNNKGALVAVGHDLTRYRPWMQRAVICKHFLALIWVHEKEVDACAWRLKLGANTKSERLAKIMAAHKKFYSAWT